MVQIEAFLKFLQAQDRAARTIHDLAEFLVWFEQTPSLNKGRSPGGSAETGGQQPGQIELITDDAGTGAFTQQI